MNRELTEHDLGYEQASAFRSLRHIFPESALRPKHLEHWTDDVAKTAVRWTLAYHAAMEEDGREIRPTAPIEEAVAAARADLEARDRAEDAELLASALALVSAHGEMIAAQRAYRNAASRMSRALAPCDYRDGFALPLIVGDCYITDAGPGEFFVIKATRIDPA